MPVIVEKTAKSYDYTGVKDCKMVAFMQNGGEKACSYGCLGYGSCVKVCGFDAIHIINGIAVVEKKNVRHAENAWQNVQNI